MEIIANCPKISGYARDEGTYVDRGQVVFHNAGLVTCLHDPCTDEDVRKAIDAGYPVSTGHHTRTLWGQQDGGHQVATVGYLKNSQGEVSAYLVRDTGLGCSYYVSAERYRKSMQGNASVVVGYKECRDAATGVLVKPGACCLAAYNRRKADLQLLMEKSADLKAQVDAAETDYLRSAQDYAWVLAQYAQALAAGNIDEAHTWQQKADVQGADYERKKAAYEHEKAILDKQSSLDSSRPATPMGA